MSINAKKAELRLKNHSDYLKSLSRLKSGSQPNVVVVFCDDMGYGDISCFGSTAINTPNLDRMAEDGAKYNNFYAASPVCSPSRFGLLTGRLPNRNFTDGVFFPTRKDIKGEQPPLAKRLLYGLVGKRMAAKHGVQGILPDEVTVAEVLQNRGYKTGIFGKWHLGDDTPYLPNQKGFDYFFGSYYSNDMEPYAYFRNEEQVIDAPADQTKLTGILTEEIKTFIKENKETPFFVYYPSPFPHFPVHSSEAFRGKSKAGAYGDCVEEIDWSVGEIIKTLEEEGLADNTLVIVTSDNGPWFEGSPGLHRGRKGNNFDGGQAVPMIAKWPGQIPPNTEVDEMAMNIDIFPTLLEMTETPLPTDRIIDGRSILPLLTGATNQTPHEELLFVGPKKYFAIRDNENFKFFDKAKCENSKYGMMKQGPYLFNLNIDQNESYDVTNLYPEKRHHLEHRLEQLQSEYELNPRGWL